MALSTDMNGAAAAASATGDFAHVLAMVFAASIKEPPITSSRSALLCTDVSILDPVI